MSDMYIDQLGRVVEKKQASSINRACDNCIAGVGAGYRKALRHVIVLSSMIYFIITLYSIA